MFDPQSIDALNEVLQNSQVWSIFSIFFASIKTLIDLPKYQPSLRFGHF